MAVSLRVGSGGIAIFGLDELIDRFQKVEQSDRLEAALYDLGDQLQEEMNRNIGNHPTLQNAQEVRVKIYDGGGYAAIKPKTGGYRITKNRKAYRAKGRKKAAEVFGILLKVSKPGT